MINQPLTQSYFAMRAETTTSRIISVLNDLLPALGIAVDARPTDISLDLNIDMKLAWKVSHLLRSKSPAEVLGGLPGRSGFLKLLSGLKRAGADAERLDELQRAFDELHTDVATHAGSKSTYDSMVLGLGASSELPLAMGQRRVLMQAMSSVIGLQCRSLYALDVLGPRLGSGGFERVSAVSYDGISRLWSGVPWCLRMHRLGSFGEGPNRRTVSGFDETGAFDGRFLCTYSGLNGIKIKLRSDAHPEYQDFSLESDGIGPRHAARIVHAFRVSHDSVGTEPLQSLRIDLPVQHCEMDLILHRSWLDTLESITASVSYPGQARNLGTDDSWKQRLPIELNSSSDESECRHGPPVGWSAEKHSQLLQRAFESLGHDADEFSVHRVTFSYPPMPADISHGEIC